MHSPETLAFEIPRPWKDRRGYRPRLVTVWHIEPGGKDSGEVCKHYRREQLHDGTWKATRLNGWRWHVHHWQISFAIVGKLRRRFIDRCAWCSGRDTKGDPCNISAGWGSTRAHWWTTARGIYHDACHSAWHARLACSCEDPISTGPWETCARCGLNRYNRSDMQREVSRILIEMVPEGAKPTPEVMALVRNLWAVERARREADA